MEPKLNEVEQTASRAVGSLETLKTRVALETEVGVFCLHGCAASLTSASVTLQQELKSGVTKSLEVSQHLLPFPPARPRPRARSLTRATKQGLVKDLDELTEKVRTPLFGTLNVLLKAIVPGRRHDGGPGY